MGYVLANDQGDQGDQEVTGGVDGRCLEEGKELYRTFHNSPARHVVHRRFDRRRNPMRPPRTLVDLGELRGLIYSADRDGCGEVKTFIHFMETPPRLMCDQRGDQLYVVGGRYRVTRRGIEG